MPDARNGRGCTSIRILSRYLSSNHARIFCLPWMYVKTIFLVHFIYFSKTMVQYFIHKERRLLYWNYRCRICIIYKLYDMTMNTSNKTKPHSNHHLLREKVSMYMYSKSIHFILIILSCPSTCEESVSANVIKINRASVIPFTRTILADLLLFGLYFD